MIDHLTIQKILDAAQIAEVIQEFVPLKRRGVNLLGLCPFHNEKTPSFTVSPSKGIFKCFGCGKGGNVVNFIMEHEHLSYPEALRYLARKYHIEIEEKEITREDIEKQNERESMLVITTYAGKQFMNNLFNTDEGQAVGLSYFRERGFRQDTLKKFETGYSMEKRNAFTEKALSEGFDEVFLVKTGLSIKHEERLFDRFSGRIIFPIHSLSGQILGFGGRILKSDPKAAKYINSPESDIYHKSRIVYGIFQARKAITKEDKCYLVEGYTDVLSLHEAGIENVVASSGTSLTVEQVRLIKRFTRNITIIYDGDEAGIKASIRGIDIVLEEGMNVKIVLLPNGEDPDSFSRKITNEEFRNFVKEQETDFIRFKTKLLLSEAKNDPVKRTSFLREMVNSIAVIPETISRTVYIKECSSMMDVPEAVIYNEVNKLRRQKSFQDRNKYPAPEDLPAPVTAQPREILIPVESFHSESEIIRLLLKYGNEIFERTISKEDGTETITTIADYIVQEITADNLIFENPVFSAIFNDYKFHVNQGIFPGDHHFIRNPDPDISSISANLLADSYEISKIWREKQAYFLTEVDLLKKIVEDSVLKFKGDKIKALQKTIMKQIHEVSEKGDFNGAMILQKRYDSLNKTLSVISKKLGDRII
ncbi:MAG: DNA primase, partial [Bacteroidales bacterium]